MDGKLLILCDEMPGTHSDGQKEYKIRDSRFLAVPMRHPEDDVDRIFVSWDSIIPEDRAFIEQCKYYARFIEKPKDPLFGISRRGSTDPADGTLKDSVQEASYYDTFERNFNYLYRMMKSGEDWQGEAMELGVQYPLDADERFFSDLVRLVNNNGIVAILPCFSEEKEGQAITKYRRDMLEIWKNRNDMRRKSGFRRTDEYSTAQVLDFETYSDFEEILYGRSSEEIMKIYSMPIFGEPTNNSSHSGEHEER